MATVIDALIVSLGLDVASFKAGMKHATDDLKRSKDEAAKTAKEMEARGKQASQFFSKLRTEAIALFAVFTAGRGVKDFIRDITTSDAATGRLARNLGITVESLSTWRGAAERAGGSAAGIDSTLSNLAQQFQQLQLTGQSSVLPYFRSLGVEFTGTEKDLDGLNRAVQGMDRREALFKLRGAGVDEQTAQLLLETPERLAKLRDESARLAPVTKRNADNAEALRVGLLNLRDGATGLARELLDQFSPALAAAMEAVKGWLIEHRPEIVQTITQAVSDFKNALAEIDWKTVVESVKAFVHGADAVAHALGGWTQATELLFGLWLGAKGLKFMALVASLFGMGGGGAGGGGLMRLLGPLQLAIAGWQGAKAMERAGTLDGPEDWINEHLLGHEANEERKRKRAEWRKQDADGTLPPDNRSFGTRMNDTIHELVGLPRPSEAAGAGTTQAAAGPNKALLDLIGKAEGTDKGRGYNETLGYGAYTGGDVNLTGMTLGQIKQLQTQMLANPKNTMNSSALGRYQITRSTLKDLQAQLGIGDDAKFDPAMQDRLASHLIQTRARGSMYDQQKGLASIWASFPSPDTGKSAYGQHTALTSAQVQGVLSAPQAPVQVASAAPSSASPILPASPLSQRNRLADLRGVASDDAAAGAGAAQRAARRQAAIDGIHKLDDEYRAKGMTEEQLIASHARTGSSEFYQAPGGRPGWFNELPARGAAPAAAAAGGDVHHNDNRAENNVNGPITIHTQATDAAGIAGAMGGALRSKAFMPQANSGLA